jgi:hypothetical protein
VSTAKDGASAKLNLKKISGGVIVVLVVYVLVAYWRKLPPFDQGDQPIIISDSSVDTRINGKPIVSADGFSLLIKGKFHHVTMVDGNGVKFPPKCDNTSCNTTSVNFQLENYPGIHRISIRERADGDTDLVIEGVAWNSNFWSHITDPPPYTTLRAAGKLIDDSGISPCTHCKYYFCFSKSGNPDATCDE